MAEFVSIKKDEVLFEDGDVADAMYIVKSGMISIIISDDKVQKEVSRVSTGQLIGEMSLFDKRFRSATAKAITNAELVKLPYSKLEAELATMPEWVQVTLKTLVQKIRDANKKILG